MSSSLDRAVKDFVQILQESKEKGTSPYDTTATVTRVEDSIAWVHIPGGVEETPVQMTMNVNAGDTVQVRVSGGKAWIAGNATSPPTDDTVAKEAEYKALMAEEVAKIAGEKAENSEATAKRALRIADDTDQYFWHMESGTDTGTHITEIPHDEFIARTAEDPTDGGPNLLARSGGIAVRNGLEELAQFSDYIRLGKDNESRAFIDFHSLQLVDKEGNTYFHVSDLREREVIEGEVFYLAEIKNWLDASDPAMVQDNTVFLTHPITILEQALLNMDEDITEFASFVRDTNEVDFNGITIGGFDTVYVKYKTAAPSNAYTLGSRTLYDPIGAGSVVAGKYCIASGLNSFAEGLNTMASGDYSHAEGEYSVASGKGAHAEGAIWNYNYDDPLTCTASGHGAHAEGLGTSATELAAHAEGGKTKASGSTSHAEGYDTTASGGSAHVEGEHSVASGHVSHAEGFSTKATGENSHAQNAYTIAAKANQTAIGKYNIEDTQTTESAQKALIIGNGTSASKRSNAFTVDWKGRVTLYKEGAIAFEGTKATYDMISFLDNTADGFGNGIRIGGGGVVIIGSGEYSTNRWGVGDVNAGTENTYIGADGSVYIEPNGDTIANRKTFTFDANGYLSIPKSLKFSAMSDFGKNPPYILGIESFGDGGELKYRGAKSVSVGGLLDAGNNNVITANYSAAGLSSTSWFAAWNGYELRAINPANALTSLGLVSGVTSGQSVPANGYKDFKVSFGKTFSSTPTVVATIVTTATTTNYAHITAVIQARSTTGATIRVFNGTGAAYSPAVAWMAMS